MSKTIAILLGLALVWLTAWSIAAYFTYQAGSEKLAHAEHLSTPATRLEPGAEVRVEGTLVAGPTVPAPYSEKPCLAAVTNIFVMSRYRDSQDHDVHQSNWIATRRAGPGSVQIAVGDARLELPVERWAPRELTSESLTELPDRLAVTPEELATAKANARGTVGNYRVAEAHLQGGDRVFVAGRLEAGSGSLRLEADPLLGYVELYPGPRDELVKQLRDSGAGVRVAGWVFAALGPVPLAILAVVLAIRRKKLRAAT